MAINRDSCILALSRGNMTFHLIFIKPFNVLDIEIEVNPLELEYNSQETKSKESIIIINTSLTVFLKYSKGRSRKNINIIIFL